MNNENELLGGIKQFANIIVYGAKIRGHKLVERLKEWLPQTNIHVAVSDTKGEIEYCGGLLVKDIGAYAEMAEASSVVLIAATEYFHDEIERTAHSFGFANVIRISEFLWLKIIGNSNGDLTEITKMQRNAQFLQYQTMNLMRLAHLRNKVRQGEKIKVVFPLIDKAKFSFASVYLAMKDNPLYEAALFLINKNEKSYAEELIQAGFNVVWGFDESDEPISIDALEPDIIIYNICYLKGYKDFPHRDDMLIGTLNSLSCYLSYGTLIPKQNYAYHFENDEVLPAWRYFLCNRHEYALAANSPITNGLHHVLSGDPILDAYAGEPGLVLPTKLRNKEKLIIFAPHWSMGYYYRITSFHVFWRRIIEFLKECPNVGFVFKPHPELQREIQRSEQYGNRGQPTYAEWLEYCRIWEESPNGVIVSDSSYIDWFRHSDCLITDSLSFIVSWLPTDKPCIYLKNPNVSKEEFWGFFYDHIRPVVESYYICDDEQELKRLVEDVVIGGADVKADDRKRQKDSVIYNFGHAGEFIADYIERQVRA